ncbi:MAG TPA: UDP-N-acetylglucosamine 1-carboxyvinyltransferase, partial [Planctomycetaceae bacterium]|nr:UDP-N-acetylglucosamine 1-carboxyvinyltransferase [Planctomycetaceae bacterium]
MDQLKIQGGVKLQGTISVSGAKNAALPIMAACLAIPGRTILSNIPQLRDTNSMIQLLTQLGVKIEESGHNSVILEPQSNQISHADYDLVRTMRASVCVLGPLLASRGEACVSLPGGCNIGHRPIDLQ